MPFHNYTIIRRYNLNNQSPNHKQMKNQTTNRALKDTSCGDVWDRLPGPDNSGTCKK